MWINILNIAFLWRLGNSDIVKKPEIQGWIMFVYNLHWVYMYFCLPENSLYILFFFSVKKNQWRRKRKFNSQRLQIGKLNKEKCEISRRNWTKEKGLSICHHYLFTFLNFTSTTTEWISMKLDQKQVLKVLYQNCAQGANPWANMDALISSRLQPLFGFQ